MTVQKHNGDKLLKQCYLEQQKKLDLWLMRLKVGVRNIMFIIEYETLYKKKFP